MESNLLLHCRSLSACPASRKQVVKPGIGGRKPAHELKFSRVVVAVVAKPKDNPAGITGNTTTTTTVYVDNWFDRLAINHLSESVQFTSGMRNEKEGYDGLMEAASMVARNFGPRTQRELMNKALSKAFPEPILALIKSILPDSSKFTREFFASFTTVFFSWLVGRCEVRESEFQGGREKNVVYIPKCRFLEGTNCVGMCTNLCKMPCQKFIQDSLGMPVNMVPMHVHIDHKLTFPNADFDDMSCEMIFGQNPPADKDDPALKQPCYKSLCKARQTHGLNCSS